MITVNDQPTSTNPGAVDWSKHPVWCTAMHDDPGHCERVVRWVVATGESEPVESPRGALVPTATVKIVGYPARGPREDFGWIELLVIQPGDFDASRTEVVLTCDEADELASGLAKAVRLLRSDEVIEDSAFVRGCVDDGIIEARAV